MKRETVQQLKHLCAGLITLAYGFDFFESGQFSSASYSLGLAIFYLIVAGSYKWIVRKFMGADVAILLLEGFTMLYAGWSYRNKGHEVIYFLLLGAGAAYLVFAFIALIHKDKPKHRSSKRRRRRRQLDDNESINDSHNHSSEDEYRRSKHRRSKRSSEDRES